ncbi:MAG: PAS domain S-box protein [Anaerolineae bacterium]|nr:PAS domain S-box protein [Anaerolineae bacterium]
MIQPRIQSVLLRGARFWMRLTTPHVSVTDPYQCQQSRLLSSMLLAGVVVMLILILIPKDFGDIYPPFDGWLLTSLTTIAGLLFCYRLSRIGRYRAASLIILALGTIAIFLPPIIFNDVGSYNSLYYLPILTLLAGLFLSLPVALGVTSLHLLALLIFGPLISGVTLIQILSGPFSSNFFLSVFALLVVYHRTLSERLRQEELSRSEQRYREITELISDYAYSIRVEPDGALKHEWLTEAPFRRVTGYTHDELDDGSQVGLNLYAPEDSASLTTALEKTLRGEVTYGEHLITTKSGQKRWISISRQPVWDAAENRVTRFFGVAKDITDRKQAEMALRESETRYRLLTETTPDFVSLYDVKNQRYLYINPAYERGLGYTIDELNNLVFTDLIHPDDRVEATRIRLEAAMGVPKDGFEYRIKTRNGSYIWIETYLNPIRDESGEVYRVLVSSRDITARKEATAALTDSEERYRILAELMSDYAYYFRVNPDGTQAREWITDSVTRVTGYTPEEMPDQFEELAKIFYPDDLELAREGIKRLLKGQSVSNETRLRTKSGEIRWLTVRRFPVFDENRTRVVGYYGVAQDITERKQSELALKASEERYRTLAELVSDFAYYFRVNPDGSQVREWITDSVTHITGYASEELPQDYRELAKLLKVENITQVADSVKRLRDGESTETEVRIITKSGETRWLTVRRSPVKDEINNQMLGYYGVAQDITERKQTELALKVSEERYRNISELISDYAYSCIVQPDGTIDYDWVTSASFFQITGYGVEELGIYKTGWGQGTTMFPPDEAEKVSHELQKVLQNQATHAEHRIITKSGEERWLHIFRRPVWDAAQNRVVRFLGVAQDITERKQAELALKASEERYRLITELISDYAYSLRVEPDGSLHHEWITEVPFRRVTGYTHAEIDDGSNVNMRLFPLDEEPSLFEEYKRTLQNIPTHGEHRIITKSGEERWIQIHRHPVWDDKEQRVIRFYGVTQDITERKRTELALKASEERYRRVSELISDYAYYVRIEPDGTRVREWITDSFFRVTGYLPAELDLPQTDRLLDSRDIDRFYADLEHVLAGSTITEEYRITTKAGQTRWLSLRLQPVWDEYRNHVIGYYGVAQDATDRKLAEQALQAGEERYRRISDLISDYAYYVRVNPDGTRVREWITDSFTRLTGYPPEEVTEIHLTKLFHPDDMALVDQDRRRVLNGETVRNEYRIFTRSGEQRWLEILREPVLDESSAKVVGYYAAAQDITQRKLAEAQKLRLALEHEQLTMVSQFVLALSHDFRTSLATIETSRYLVERLIESENTRLKITPKLESIRHSVNHIASQLENLHMVSSLTSPSRTPSNLNRLVENITASQQPRAYQNQITLSLQLALEIPYIYIDETKIETALSQLILNAIAHTPAGGTVTVRTHHDETLAYMSVQDTGVGIDEDQRTLIFEPFYRIDQSRKIDTGGMGLGLTITRMIAEAHGGRIEVASQKGVGSTFTIALPLTTQPETLAF